MTFPSINIKMTHMTLTPELQSLIEQKFLPLGKFVHDHGDAKCELEIERMTDHQSGKIFRAEANFFLDGKLFRAEATREQIEQAIDATRTELRNALQRAQGRRRSLLHRGHGILKSMLRLGKQ